MEMRFNGVDATTGQYLFHRSLQATWHGASSGPSNLAAFTRR